MAIEVRNGFILVNGKPFPPGVLLVNLPFPGREGYGRKVLVTVAGVGPVMELDAEGVDASIQLHLELERELTRVETKALAQIARAYGLPMAFHFSPSDWRAKYPEEGDIKRLLGFRGRRWKAIILGGRDPEVLIVPRGYEVEYLSAREAEDACRSGLPVIAHSAHGAWKVVKRQGALVRHMQSGRYWRPSKVPPWTWDSKARRFLPGLVGNRHSPLLCGDPSPVPGGSLEWPGEG